MAALVMVPASVTTAQPDLDDVSSASWERVIDCLQAIVSDAESSFEVHMSDGAKRDRASSCDALVHGEVRLDIQAVCDAGDKALLEEVALDLTVCSLRRRIVPRFWQQVDRSASSQHWLRVWGDRFGVCLVALQTVQAAHEAALIGLGTDGASRLAGQYRSAFRVAVEDSWPTRFSEELKRYFRNSWRQHRRFFRKGLRRPIDDAPVEEWWWSSNSSSFGDGRAPNGLADRVLKLLDPSRHPSASLAVAIPSVADGFSGYSCEDDDVAMDGSEDPETLAEDSEVDGDEEEERDCDDDVERDDAHIRTFQRNANVVRRLGLSRVWFDVVAEFLSGELAAIVEARCQREYDSRGLLRQLTAFLYNPLLRWLRTAHGLPIVAGASLNRAEGRTSESDTYEAETAWWVAARRVVLQFFEAFVEVRIREAFDMVRDFPDSVPALMDLRCCLARTGQTAPFIAALRQQLSRRLLIAGAHTRDVIKVYIKTIKAMRLVDPRGLLLEAVSAPIRAHLRRRKDTVRCIVMALTQDTDLQVELQAAVAQTSGGQAGPSRHQQLPAGEETADGQRAAAAGGTGVGAAPAQGGAGVATAGPFDVAFDDAACEASDEEEDPDAWTPDPMDADPLLPSRQRRAQDVISLLVGIYGSKEMFIKEYKEMLADRLLGSPSYVTDRETQTLELLKTRFGDAALVHCEVMLQDIKDSKRTNANIQQFATAAEARRQQQHQQQQQQQQMQHMQQVQRQQQTQQHQQSATPTALQPIRPSGVGSVAAQADDQRGRPFMAPFSLSSIFGAVATAPGNAPVAVGATVAGTAAGACATETKSPLLGASMPAACGDAATGAGFSPPGASAASSTAAAHAAGKLSLERMQPLILSQHYWPAALTKADHPQFRLPEPLEEALAEYSSAYSHTRAKRNLQWKRAHGLVEISVQLADRSINVMVTPVHLAVLSCFTDDTCAGNPGSPASTNPVRLSLQEVATRLTLPEPLARKRIGFWVSKGVLREVSAGVFAVQESLSSADGVGCGALTAPPAGAGRIPGTTHNLDEDAELSPGQAVAGSGDSITTAEVEGCVAFIQGMLTNYSALPLARIHHFLQMFMRDPVYTHTEVQLRDLLAKLCQEGRLEFNGAEYTLARKG